MNGLSDEERAALFSRPRASLTDAEREALTEAGRADLADAFERGQLGSHTERVVMCIVAARVAAAEQRVTEAVIAALPGPSCGGLTVDADGCFAADLACRVRAALARPTDGGVA